MRARLDTMHRSILQMHTFSASVYYTERKLKDKNGGDLGTRLDSTHKYTQQICIHANPPFSPLHTTITATHTHTHTHRIDHVSSSSTSHVWLHPEQTISKVLSSRYHSFVSYHPLVPCGASILIMELQGEHPGVPSIACDHGMI